MSRRLREDAVDGNLVRALQLAVAGRPFPGSGQAQEGPQGSGTTTQAGPGEIGRLGAHAELAGGAARRTTLSVPCAVGEQARRLTMAITVAEHRDASLGNTLAWALDLLEAELAQRGVPIVARSVALRSGPRRG